MNYLKFFTDTNCQCAFESECTTIKEVTEELCQEYKTLNEQGQLDKKYVCIRHTHYNVIEFRDSENNVSYVVISD